MGDVVDLSSRRKGNRSNVPSYSYEVKLFGAISEMWGADFDKILFDNDDVESAKLDRAVKKANLEYTTRLMEDGFDLTETDEETT